MYLSYSNPCAIKRVSKLQFEFYNIVKIGYKFNSSIDRKVKSWYRIVLPKKYC